ncbi:MAG: hypothetical protein K0Q55_4086, partial [Verrucomicrobia bacterium]|nr:hypothetical protein [Verrucomicrobiota bacterium]
MFRLIAAVCFASVLSLHGAENVRMVNNTREFQEAIRTLKSGTTLKLAPGDYGAGHFVSKARGTKEEPIIIEGANPSQPPKFSGGNLAIHFSGCTHLTVRHIQVQGQKGNGLNFDDGGDTSHHITIENVQVSDIGPTGNNDGIKLSGVDDFIIHNCRITGWAGQAIDMVGCHRGLIEKCVFEGKTGYSQATGPQTKGGSEDITVRGCTFINAGQRPMHLGGSTGRPYFRPKDAKYEARRITVEGNLIIGGMAPIVFTGVEQGVVRYNTIVNPETWAFRILQENNEPGMVPCSNGVFEKNIIVCEKNPVRSWLNIGGNAQAATFKFADNWWYHKAPSQPAKPPLPSAEQNGTYGMDPQLDA